MVAFILLKEVIGIAVAVVDLCYHGRYVIAYFEFLALFAML